MNIHIPLSFGNFSSLQAIIAVSSVVAFILPYVTALVNNRKMSDLARIAMSAFMALLAAILQVILMNKFDFANLTTAFSVIFPFSIVFYHRIALKLGVRTLENLTSPIDLQDATHILEDKPLSTSSVQEATKQIILEAPAQLSRIAEKERTSLDKLENTSILEATPTTSVVNMADLEVMVSHILEKKENNNG